MIDLHPEEPAADFTPTTANAFARLVRERLAREQPGTGRSLVLVDGRSGGGKTTLAALLADELGASIAHVDDLSWYESPTDWAPLLLEGVLEPWGRGEAVAYRPPAWEARSRPGAIEIPAHADLLVVEGVGSARASLAADADLVIWVQSDRLEARRRGIERDASSGTRTPAQAAAFWDEWAMAEDPFLATERPWTRADLVVWGTPPDDRLWWSPGPLT